MLVVNQVMSMEDPCCWNTRNEVLLLRHLYNQHEGWSLVWVPRDQNKAADCAAKWAPNLFCNVEIRKGFANYLPSAFLCCIALERTQFPLLL